ncbi:DUF3072 domain-containing protein [Nocardioides mesophilus]|uniref:DUF3072 domain-containing protein n=1 Tax=Nocardioides mesophilus TaxID=433659 RepID=A0A7G9RAU1_9ACTN|nr:DUF3072 domain-containing protein [Nocardioides mesophilus]QNN52716.1 DUF3072 domain-containing protein [Nocardioides mesophilus]
MTESNMHSNQDQMSTGEPDVLGAPAGNTTEKDPNDWATGDEPMTGAQRSYLDTLAREAGETLQADLTKAEASQHIDRLQAATGRGDSGPTG